MEVDTIIHCRWIVPVVPENVYHSHHSLIIKDGKIMDLLPIDLAKSKYKTQDPSNTLFLEEDQVLLPGFINMHSHSPMSLLRGFATDVQLTEWLMVFDCLLPFFFFLVGCNYSFPH